MNEDTPLVQGETHSPAETISPTSTAPLSPREKILLHAEKKGLMIHADALELLGRSTSYESILDTLAGEN
ncbi:MAG: hypothetical protein FJY86_03595, partial [Candidatus Diapherotrites archaeon]|nr:hypothetical protein [Candidatus Diapherotrites archaeon]